MQPSRAQQFQRKVIQLVHSYLPGSSAHVAPGKLTHKPPCYHCWHLNVRLSNWLKCVPYLSQLSVVLSLCPWRSRVFKNVTDWPLAKQFEEDDIWNAVHLQRTLESTSLPLYRAKHGEQGFKLHLQEANSRALQFYKSDKLLKLII